VGVNQLCNVLCPPTASADDVDPPGAWDDADGGYTLSGLRFDRKNLIGGIAFTSLRQMLVRGDTEYVSVSTRLARSSLRFAPEIIEHDATTWALCSLPFSFFLAWSLATSPTDDWSFETYNPPL
jgi:hypothetical protein